MEYPQNTDHMFKIRCITTLGQKQGKPVFLIDGRMIKINADFCIWRITETAVRTLQCDRKWPARQSSRDIVCVPTQSLWMSRNSLGNTRLWLTQSPKARPRSALIFRSWWSALSSNTTFDIPGPHNYDAFNYKAIPRPGQILDSGPGPGPELRPGFSKPAKIASRTAHPPKTTRRRAGKFRPWGKVGNRALRTYTALPDSSEANSPVQTTVGFGLFHRYAGSRWSG